MHFTWERLADGVYRCRLPFLDVTVGVVAGTDATLVVDTGSTRDEGFRLAADVEALGASAVTHVVLTHHHFDHVLGSSVFDRAEMYAAPAVVDAMTVGRSALGADAVLYGADPGAVADATARLRAPDHAVTDSVTIDLGAIRAEIRTVGHGHTTGDLVVLIPRDPAPVVFCGDLVEESGEPVIDDDSDLAAWPRALDGVLELGGPHATYVPGHGAVVDAEFVAHQREWLRNRT